jgi:hypothetical protein
LAVLNARDLLLQPADYIVMPAMSAEEGLRLFHEGDFEIIDFGANEE